jgi:cytochrome c peroxidase
MIIKKLIQFIKNSLFFIIGLSLLAFVSCKPIEPDIIIKKEVVDTSLISVSSEMPNIVSFPDNKVTRAGLDLGRFLFYDPLLSDNNTISCGSCHNQALAFTDNGLKVSIGSTPDKIGNRNAMPTFNLMWYKGLFWDSRASRLKQLALMPIQNPLEMNTLPEIVVEKLKLSSMYRTKFKNAFGSDSITVERLALALEQFLMSMVSDNSKFDKKQRGELNFTNEEQRGFDIASQKGCFNCHSGSLFTDNISHNTGLDPKITDKGLGGFTKLVTDEGLFKTPSLRNVAVTAPFMHDGRFESLEQVIDFYDHEVNINAPNINNPTKGFLEQGMRNRITDSDKKALIAFLNTLTDYNLITNPKFSDPFK